MLYIVIELQTINDSQVANIVNAYTEQAVAEQKYHSILAAAAVSALPCHVAVMLDEKGRMIKSEFYTHEVAQNE